MAKTQTVAPEAPVMDEAAQEEMRRLLLEAPIAELAENQGISIDEAVALRVEQAIAAAPRPVEVTVRPIEPHESNPIQNAGCVYQIRQYHNQKIRLTRKENKIP